MLREIIFSLEEKLYAGGVYIDLKMREDSIQRVKQWMNENIPTLERNLDLHCTMIYSKKEHDIDFIPLNYTVDSNFKSFEIFGPERDTLVVCINSPEIEERQKELSGLYGFVSDFPDYKPHFTIAYNCPSELDISLFPIIDFPIYFERETITPLKLDWKPTKTIKTQEKHMLKEILENKEAKGRDTSAERTLAEINTAIDKAIKNKDKKTLDLWVKLLGDLQKKLK